MRGSNVAASLWQGMTISTRRACGSNSARVYMTAVSVSKMVRVRVRCFMLHVLLAAEIKLN